MKRTPLKRKTPMKRGVWRRIFVAKKQAAKETEDDHSNCLYPERRAIKAKGTTWLRRKRSVGIKTQRSPLKKRSAQKAKLNTLYLLALRFLLRQNPLCRVCEECPATEGHHPWGQLGWLILLFWPICRNCHRWIEDHKNKARELGLILYK